jgi:dATP pyrophosphohydrolase
VRLPHEVLVVVRRVDEFLILHRSPSHGAYWHCVSGAVEEAEAFDEAAARELREETGLDASLVDLEQPYEYEIQKWEPHYSTGAERVIVHSFLADAPGGWEPELDWEHDDYRWCGLEDATMLLYWPEPRELLRGIA